MRHARTALALCSVAAVLALPAGASAATATASGLTVYFSAAAGETNRVTIAPTEASDDGGTVEVREHNGSLTAGSGCTQIDASTAHCVDPWSPEIRNVNVALGDGDDKARVEGAYEYVRADGSAGDDTIIVPGNQALGEDIRGGDGDDRLDIVGQPDPLGSVLGGGGFPIHSITGGAGHDRIRSTAGGGETELHGEGGNDTIHGRGFLRGGDGDDRFVGGGFLVGDAGDDRFDTRDLPAVHDELHCGDGDDMARVDDRDSADFECETVEVGLL